MQTGTVEEIRFLDVVKPDFSAGAAGDVLERIFGVEGRLDLLESERDLNFRVTGLDGSRYLLKISNRAEPLDTIEFEIEALRHIAVASPDLPVPRVLTARDGTYYGTVESRGGIQHCVRLLTFVPGTVLADVCRTDALILDQGKKCAHMALALRDFMHPAADSRRLLWDVREIASLKPVAETLPDTASRTVILGIIETFLQEIKPRLAGLRHQVAHMDLTRDNMVVDKQAPEVVSGILDVGDMHRGPLAQDIAVAIADVMQPETEPFDKATIFLRGYSRVLPLHDEEIELLFDLVIAYFAAYFLILSRRGNAYFAADRDSVIAIIEDLQKKGRERTTDLFAKACMQPTARR
jgi:hydroxylysine kinase